MSTNFSANQYQNAFRSNILGNWEKPSEYCDNPQPQDGYTKVIANDRGHLLEGVPKSTANPWGNFVGTWDLPKQIPGNTAAVATARTTYAQEKLQKDSDNANEVLGGHTKNQTRHDMRQGGVKGAKGECALTDGPTRSGADAPGSKMFPDATYDNAASPSRQYTPLGSFPQYSPAHTPQRTPTPQIQTKPMSPQVESPIPGVPDFPEIYAQGSREPTPESYRAEQGLSAL